MHAVQRLIGRYKGKLTLDMLDHIVKTGDHFVEFANGNHMYRLPVSASSNEFVEVFLDPSRKIVLTVQNRAGDPPRHRFHPRRR